MKNVKCPFCGKEVSCFTYYVKERGYGCIFFKEKDTKLEQPVYDYEGNNDSEITGYECPECYETLTLEQIKRAYTRKKLNGEE